MTAAIPIKREEPVIGYEWPAEGGARAILGVHRPDHL